MLGAAFAAVAMAANFIPPKLFGDWYAGCDNGHYCTAVALLPELAYNDNPPKWFAMAVDLPPSGAPNLHIDAINPSEPDKTPDLRLSLSIDGKAAGIRFDERGTARAVSPGTIDSLAKAHVLAVADGAGKVVARISTAGAAHALAWVSRMRASPAPLLPRIDAPPRSNTAPARLTAAQLRSIRRAHDCSVTDEKPQFVRLDAATTLALLPCSDEGDTPTSVAMLVSNSGATHVPQFDAAYQREPRSGDSNELDGASFDMKSFTVQQVTGGTAMGDCGEARAWIWDGRRFRIGYQQVMEQCRGSYAMVPVWRTANLEHGMP